MSGISCGQSLRGLMSSRDTLILSALETRLFNPIPVGNALIRTARPVSSVFGYRELNAVAASLVLPIGTPTADWWWSIILQQGSRSYIQSQILPPPLGRSKSTI